MKIPLFILSSIALILPACAVEVEKVYPGETIVRLLGGKGLSAMRASKTREYLKTFKLADTDRNDYLDYDEYVTKGTYKTESDRKNFFQGADANGDEFVSKLEYVNHIYILTEGVKIFSQMDMNEDWSLTPSEMVKKSGLRTKNTIAVIFKKMDADNNNQVSYEEFIVKWTYWSRGLKS